MPDAPDAAAVTAAHRILQLSDLHLTPRETTRAWRTDVWAGFRAVLAELENLVPFDRLVLTGDLANRPSRSTYRRLREALSPWIERVRVIPGNHDGRRALRAVFSDRLAAGRATFVDQVGDFRLVGLDSKRTPFVHGKLGSRQLAELRAELADGAPTLLFLHHPPAPVGTWWLDKDVVRDVAALTEIVRGSGVRAVFCGHVHQEFTGEVGGAPLFCCPSTAYQFRPGAVLPAAVAERTPAFRSIDLHGGDLVTRVVRPGAAASSGT